MMYEPLRTCQRKNSYFSQSPRRFPGPVQYAQNLSPRNARRFAATVLTTVTIECRVGHELMALCVRPALHYGDSGIRLPTSHPWSATDPFLLLSFQLASGSLKWFTVPPPPLGF